MLTNKPFQVNDLLEASKTFDNLGSILDHDVDDDSVKKPGSLSRHLRRVRQGLDLIKALFEQFLSSRYVPNFHLMLRYFFNHIIFFIKRLSLMWHSYMKIYAFSDLFVEHSDFVLKSSYCIIFDILESY